MAKVADSWSDWFDTHAAALVLLARRWVSCQADAEDVVQDAFLRFWRSREQVQEPAGYLYACVKHCALDSQRGRRRQQRREHATARPEAESFLFCRNQQSERRAVIEAALSRLPNDQAEVLIMKIWGGLTFPQIAAALEISPNTASSRFRYALAKLREQLVEEAIP